MENCFESINFANTFKDKTLYFHKLNRIIMIQLILLSFVSFKNQPDNSNNILLGVTIGVCFLLIVILYAVWRDRHKIKKAHLALLQSIQKQNPLFRTHAIRAALYGKQEKEKENSAEYNKEKEKLDAAIYAQLLHLMNEEKIYHDPKLTRDEVVARLKTSRKIFLEVLQKHIDMSFIEYINTFRLNEAVSLLENEDYTNETIAEEVGFGSTNTFYRQFRARYGVSPSEYRKALFNNYSFASTEY